MIDEKNIKKTFKIYDFDEAKAIYILTESLGSIWFLLFKLNIANLFKRIEISTKRYKLNDEQKTCLNIIRKLINWN